MKKTIRKILSAALTLTLIACLGIPAMAADITTSGGSASTPVTLSSTSDGTIGGTPAATALSVTVPTVMPMAVGQDGTVTTATNCQITNNSYGAVRVRSVSISGADGWSLVPFGDKSTLAAEKVDSNKLGFSLSIGGGSNAATNNSDSATQTLILEPIDGCYLTGSGNSSGKTAAVSYQAIVTPVSTALTDATIASILFVVEWDT